jgi:phosphotransferase system  glucose/maltose/N-acetylglucosamine-specific IIC component
MREQMFPGVEMYSANQIAAADAAIAALSPEERKAILKIALKAALAASDKAQ